MRLEGGLRTSRAEEILPKPSTSNVRRNASTILLSYLLEFRETTWLSLNCKSYLSRVDRFLFGAEQRCATLSLQDDLLDCLFTGQDPEPKDNSESLSIKNLDSKGGKNEILNQASATGMFTFVFWVQVSHPHFQTHHVYESLCSGRRNGTEFGSKL